MVEVYEGLKVMKERKLSKGGFEEIYPEIVEEILTCENPDNIAINANLSKRQWDCISEYLDNSDINRIAKELALGRPNVYIHLSQGFTKLEKWRRGK